MSRDTWPLKPICDKEGCDYRGQAHPKCRAHNRFGQACKVSPMKGQNVCDRHGGQAGKEKGIRREAIATAMTKAQALVQFDPNDPTTPEEALLTEVKRSGQIVDRLSGMVGELADDSLLIAQGQAGTLSLHPFVEAWDIERLNHAKLAKLAIDAGISERMMVLAEGQAGLIVNVVVNVLQHAELHLTPEQIVNGKRLAAQSLRSLPSAG